MAAAPSTSSARIPSSPVPASPSAAAAHCRSSPTAAWATPPTTSPSAAAAPSTTTTAAFTLRSVAAGGIVVRRGRRRAQRCSVGINVTYNGVVAGSNTNALTFTGGGIYTLTPPAPYSTGNITIGKNTAVNAALDAAPGGLFANNPNLTIMGTLGLAVTFGSNPTQQTFNNLTLGRRHGLQPGRERVGNDDPHL